MSAVILGRFPHPRDGVWLFAKFFPALTQSDGPIFARSHFLVPRGKANPSLKVGLPYRVRHQERDALGSKVDCKESWTLDHVALSDVRVFINRKLGLRLESGRLCEMDQLVFCLPEKKWMSIYACISFLAALPPYLTTWTCPAGPLATPV
jgi:hypothetical protein